MESLSMQKMALIVAMIAMKENHKIIFIYLGTCALHMANNSFGKLVKELSKIDYLDQMAIDFHFFFKYTTG